jgi:hypothetical protein
VMLLAVEIRHTDSIYATNNLARNEQGSNTCFQAKRSTDVSTCKYATSTPEHILDC